MAASDLSWRDARPADAPAIAAIYDDGIADGLATFETRARTPEDVLAWLGGRHPVVVVEAEGRVVAWAAAYPYSPRACYADVAEISVYVAREARGRGAGRAALAALEAAARGRGFRKLTGKVLAGNAASLALLRRAGFREVGVHFRHGEVAGRWHDVVVVERLLEDVDPAAAPAPDPRPGPGIRLATAGDIEAMLALWREVFPEYHDPSRPQRAPRTSITRKLAERDGLFWVAEMEGRVVGTLMAGYDGHRGWLYSLGVHPSARRSGLGRALVEVAERALAARGCPKVNLQVFAVNAGARAFWARVGYAEDEVVSFGKRLG